MKNKYKLWVRPKNQKRPTENRCVQYEETIVAIIPDYVKDSCVKQIIDQLNKSTKSLKLGW